MPPFDDELDGAKDAVDDAGAGAEEIGEGKQKVDQAGDDAADGDQDTADKASNVGHGGADAVRDVDDALKDWGVLDRNDSSISDVADRIDQITEDVFGKKQAPDSLPPVRYRLFFGRKDDITSGLMDGVENLFDDGLGVADSLLEAGADALGVGDYLGTDPFSSVMQKHSPFAEDPAELDAAESIWSVVQVRCEEGLNVVWRCELLLAADEVRDADLEDELDQTAAAGGLVDQVAGPIKSAIGAVQQIKGVVDGDPSAPAPTSPLAKRVAGIKDAASRLGSAGGIGDALGAVSDLVFGADDGASPDGPVYVNVPLDPASFLGQTCSLRISREFLTADRDRPNDVPGYAFTARYLTGVVVEMDDLGARQPKLPPGTTSTAVRTRYVRLVVMPELAKLALRRDHRVFNELPAISIVREVLRSAGVYGYLPDIPGVGAATDALGDLVSNVPFVGNAAADMVSGQFLKLMPPPSSSAGLARAGAKLPVEDWTQEREMCVQYGETDLDFVRRLLEEEGIHFTFSCRRGFERLVLVHDPSELDEAGTVDGRPVPYYWPHWQPRAAVETVTAVREWRKLRPARVTLRDFSFSEADQRATELAEPADGTTGAMLAFPAEASTAFGERYEVPGKYPFQYRDEDDAFHYATYGAGPHDRKLALLRLEEEAAGNRRVTLTSDLVGAGADTNVRLRGASFDRDGIPQPPTDGPPPADRIVVERVRWTGAGRDGAGALGGPRFAVIASAPQYASEITGWWIDPNVPAMTPVRPPRRTPKPKITSLTTATVVDWTGDHDEDEEIEHEHPESVRVRVRFHWDRRGELPLGILPPIGYIAQRGASCWCRVAQAWAGDDFGVLFVPRVGAEVIVAFEHGDPDRPVIVGSLYDGEHPVPQPGREVAREGFTPPKAAAVQLSTIATRTSPWDEDDGVASELTFDDTVQKERVFLKAGRHLVEEVYGEHALVVGAAQTNEVGRDHGEIVERRQQLTIDGNRDKTVGRGQVETIRGSRDVRVGGAQKVLVTRMHAETVEGVVALVGKGDRELVVYGDRITEVGDPRGPEPIAHDRHEVTGNKTCTIQGTFRVRAKSLALGQPGDGDDAPDARLTSGPAEEDGAPELVATAENGYRLCADGEVRIVSNEASVELLATEGLTGKSTTYVLELGAPASGGVTLWHPDRVEVHTRRASLVASGTEISLEARDQAPALAVVAASGVRVSGRTGVVDAREEISVASALQTVGE
ncbi:MAG: hypothetical protein KF729_36200 [Sandaracinaceae bacterium]|nr:hypothetical protein [Sandaracinaceae bacterium]